ncbi:zinc-binding alcohol dehydrogenase family protein [Bosea caraganae]|uniref:Zinc-binding alcohol dehydrogenase family protein n=1 Tax=Bosea caraganae TaxID=2763117 RepID=A0A370KXY4_9HYPH|nr:zinc-binding alcohol dehydrogenase family protein [Bosea caraganae]RDJ30064.1 zinc-binding alcohol dehydrogenase family protein [Bosea caraganae]
MVRVTAAGVTPLDHTILSGHFPPAKAPLVLGNEGAGIVEGGDADFPDGTRVAFCGAFGVSENGSYSEYVAAPKDVLYRVPDMIDDVAAAGLPVAYLTAYLALKNAGFTAGKSVLAPAIGGSVGNAATQLARALGARHAISSTTSHVKAEAATALGFSEVIDLSAEGLADGVNRITAGYGADIVIDGIGGRILSEALRILARGGSLTTLGYSGGRETTINVTDLIWKAASIKSFILSTESTAARSAAWSVIAELLAAGKIKPIVARTFALEEAAEAMRHLIEDRPFGRVVLTI